MQLKKNLTSNAGNKATGATEAEARAVDFRVLTEQTLDVIWVMGMDLTFDYLNPALEELTEHSPDEWIGTALSEHCSPPAFRLIESTIKDQIAKGPDNSGIIFETEVLDKEGAPVPIEVHGQVIFDETGEPIRMQGTARGITERRQAEKQLRQSQRMESIGTLANGLAHEINNPINGIMNYAQLIQDKLKGADAEVEEFTNEIIRETVRVADLVRTLLNFARHDTTHYSPARLSDIIGNVLSLVRTVLRHDHINLEVNVPEDFPRINCRTQQMQQVFMNLIANARDSLNARYESYHENKTIFIRARRPESETCGWVEAEVEDLGTGILPEIAERIFDPFYTTKSRDSRTGIGLSISQDIVKKHGGMLTFATEPGKFTRFTVRLPVAVETET